MTDRAHLARLAVLAQSCAGKLHRNGRQLAHQGSCNQTGPEGNAPDPCPVLNSDDETAHEWHARSLQRNDSAGSMRRWQCWLSNPPGIISAAAKGCRLLVNDVLSVKRLDPDVPGGLTADIGPNLEAFLPDRTHAYQCNASPHWRLGESPLLAAAMSPPECAGAGST